MSDYGVFTLPDYDSYVDSETDSDNMQKGYTGLIPMQSNNGNKLKKHLIGTNIGVKLGTVAICIRIGIGIGIGLGPLYTLLKKTMTTISIGIGLGIGLGQCKHTIIP